MILVILTTVLAVTEAANIEKRYISPFNTRKSRGLFSPFGSFGIESPAVPSGGYTNDDLGVVVDAVAPGTRTSGVEPTGLGGPRTSYGSLDSKVSDAAFKVGGGAVKGTASGIGSLFGPGIDQEAHIGLPGIGFGSGSSSLDVVGKKPTGAQVTGFGVSKTTYESIHPTDRDVALGVENAAVKGGATGSGSILSSGSSQANLGLSGIGFGSGSSSLDVVGEKPTGAQGTGFGVSKTTYESLHPTDGDVALGVENAAVKGGATGSGSILSSGSSQANLGLSGIGFGSGSSSLDVVGEKPTGAQGTGFGVLKTTYESIHPTDGDVALGVENAAVKGGTTGSGSILSSGSSQANLGLSGIGFGSGSSSLDVVGEKPTGAQGTGFGVSKTTYESLHPSGGDVALGVENVAVKGGATGSGSILSSGSSQANLGLSGIGFGSGSSSLDVVGEKPTGAQGTGFGVSKTTYESIHPSGGDVALGVENAAVKGGATGSGSILSSGSSQANLGLSGIGFGSGSSSLDVVGEKPTGAQGTGFGVSKTTYESLHPSGGDVALGVENAAVKGGATGSGSILSSGSSQANLGLSGIGFGSGSSSLDVVGEKPTGAQGTGFGVSKTTYESIHPSGGDVALGVENAAVKGGATGSGSILSSGSSQANLGLSGIGFGSGSSSLDVVGEKPTGAQGTGFGVSKTTYESLHPSGGDVALGVENAAVKGGATGSGSVLSSSSSQANLGLSGIGFGSGSSSLDVVGEKPTGAQGTGFGVSKTTYESLHPTDGDVALGVENAAVKGGATGSGSILSSGSNQANLGLSGIGFGSGSSSLDVVGEKPTGAQGTGFGLSKTTYESLHPSVGDVALGVENAAVKGGATGSGSILSSGSSQANLGLSGIGFGSRSSSLDVVGEKPTGAQGTGFGVSKTTYESLHPSGGDVALGVENAAVKGGATGSGSVLSSGSSQANLGLSGIGFESINSKGGDAALNIGNEEVKGGSAGVSSVFDTSSGQEAKIGLTRIGVVPASSALDVSGKVTGSKVTGFGISKTTYESIDSTGEDAPLNIEKAAVKEGTSIIGSGTGHVGSGISSSEPVKGYEGVKIQIAKFDTKAALSTEGDASGVYSVFGSGSSQKSNIPKAGLALGISSLGTVEGYENDKIHAQKFELESGIATNPHSIGVETLTSQKQNAKEESVGHVLDGAYNVQNNNDKSDYSKYNGEENRKLSINSDDSILKPNLVGQGSAVIQGPIGNGQSLYSAGQSIENKFNGFGLSGQTETQKKPELLNDVGKIGVTGGFQTASSYGVNQESTFHNTQDFGAPNPGQQVTGSTKGNDGSSAIFGSGISNAFNTGNFNRAGQISEDSKFGSYFLTSPFYPGYKVVDNRQKLSGYEGVKFSTNSSPLKAAPHVNFQGLHFPIKNALNLDLSSPQHRQHQGLTSSHYKVITHTYVPSFTSVFSKPSTHFDQLSSNQRSFSSYGNQDSFSHKSTYLSDQKPLVQSQSNQKFTGFSRLQTQFGSTSDSEFLEKPLAIEIPTPAVFEKKPEAKSISNISSGSQNNQFGFPFSSINNAKSVTTHSSSSSYNSRSNVKPFGSPQSTGTRFSQIQFGSTFGSQSGLNSQKGIGSMSSTASQVQDTIQKDENPSGLQSIHKSIQQLQYSSISRSQSGKKPESTGTIYHTLPVLGQKTTVSSQSDSANKKTQFGFSSSSLNRERSESIQSISSTYNGGSKGEPVQSSQISVKPFGTSQSTGSGSSQTQLGSTFGSQSSLNLPKVVGSISSTTSQIQQDSQKDIKQLGSQGSFKYSQQPQYSSTSESQFGKKSESTGTISHTFPVFGQKATVTSQTSSSNEKPHFGFTSSSLTSAKSVTTHSSSSSLNGGSKDQSVQTFQSSFKPLGSSQNVGSGFSQTQFGSTFGSKNGLNSQKVAGSISSTTSQVQQNSQKDVKQSGSQDSQKSSQQLQYSSTSGSQSGKKSESTETISHTNPLHGQKTTVSSQSGSANKKTQFGFSSSSLNSERSGSTQSISSTYNGGSKGQPVQSYQINVKPFGSSQSTGSGSLQTQFGSTFGSQSSLNLQKVVGSISSTTSQVQQNSQKDVKQSGSQDSHQYSQQSQHSSLSEYQSAKKPESTGTIYHTLPVLGQKTTVSSQSGSANKRTQFGFSSSSLNSERSGSTQSISSTYNGGSKGQPVQSYQINVKPFSSSQSTGSGSLQTQFGSTLGSQSSLNLQKVVGSISSITSQVQQDSQKDIKQLGSQGSLKYSQQPQYSSTSGSQFGKKSESAGTISHTFPVFGQKATVTSQTSSSNEKPHFDFTSSTLTSAKSVTTHSSSSSLNGGSKDQSVQTSQSSFKPLGSSQNVGSSFSQTQFGSTFGSQNGLNSQKVVGSISSTTSQVQQNSQKDVKQSGSQDSHKSSQQLQYSSTSGSQSGKKSESTGTISHTNPLHGQKTTVSSQSGSANKKTQIGFSSSSLNSERSGSTQSISSTYNGGSKGQPVQSYQINVKPFGSSQSTGSGSSQTQFGSTFGSQSSLNLQKVVGSISATTTQVQQDSQKDIKRLGSQGSLMFSQQPQYSSTSGSQFGKKSESTGTISHTFPVIDQKATVTSQTSSSNEKPHFGFTSSSLTSAKSVTTHSSSSSLNGGSKDQSVQTSQSSFKPLGSSQNVGSGFSQTQFGSTFGSQKGLNSQKVVGSISSTTSQVQQNSQKDVKQSGSQDSHQYSQQSQHSSLSEYQSGKKSESTGTISHTNPLHGQKTTVSSQSGSANKKTQFGFSSSSLNSERSGSTQSISSTYNGGSKGQPVQSYQINVKPFGSSQSTGSGSLQTQFGSTFGSQSSLNLQKVVGSISSTTSQFQQNSQKDVKPPASQSTHKSSQQSQYSSTSGSQSGKKSELTGTISHTNPLLGQKTTVSSQSGSANKKTQFGFSSSSLNSERSGSTQSISSTYNGGSKGQPVQSSQISVKPFGSSQNIGSGFSQTQFGSTFGSQNGLNSQKAVGLISSSISQVQQNSQKDVKPPTSQSIHKSFQQLQYSSTSGSQSGKKSESTGTISHTNPLLGQKTTVSSQSGSVNKKTPFDFSSISLNSPKSWSTQYISSTYNGGSKGQPVQSSQISVKPFGSSQSTGSGSSQTQFGSTFGSQSVLNSQKVVGSISSTTSQVQQNSQKDVKPPASQSTHKSSQQSQYSSTSGSQSGKKSELTGTISHTNPLLGQKTTVSSQSGSANKKTQFGFSSSSLNSERSGSTQSISSTYNGGSKGQPVQSSQISVKPFGSSQNIGSGFSQTQFGSTFGSQNGLNSQKAVGLISSSISQVQQNCQKDVKPPASQSTHKSSQQSQYSSTSGSQSGKKSELTGTISHTNPLLGQKTTVSSQSGSANKKTQFGFSSSSLNSERSGSTQSISSTYNGGSKGQPVQSSQISVKPFGSSQNIGSGFSQTQFGSTFGSQNGLNSQKAVGLISSSISQVQQNSQKDVKPPTSQSIHKSFQQLQYSSTSGSQSGKKSESTGTISHTNPLLGQKTTVSSQSGSVNKKTPFDFSSISLNSPKSWSTQSISSTYNGGSKGQPVQSSQISVKPFGSSQSTGSGSSQTQFGSTFGSQSVLNSQKVVGSISSTTSQVQLNSQKDIKQLGSRDSNKYSQQSQYSLTSGSQFGKKPELTATISHTFPVVGQKKTDSDNEKTQFGSTFGSQSGLNSQKVVGSISSTNSQVQQGSQKDVEQLGSQNSIKYLQQSQYNLTSGSQFGKKPESIRTISHAFPVGQKTTITSQTSSSNEKPHFGFTSSSLTSAKSVTTHSSFSSYSGGSKDQSVQTPQSSVRPFASSQSTGSGFSETQFGSTFGSQSGLNSPKVVGSISSITSQVQLNSQKDVKQSGLQDSNKYSQQSQYNSTTGSHFGKKPEITATISHRFPLVGQKKTGYDTEKTQFGFSSSSLNSEKSGFTQSTSSSYNGKSKGQSVQSSQLSGKHIGSSQSIGSGFSQTQLGSTFGTQSGHSQKVLGTINSVSVQPISEYRKKPFGSQSDYNTFQQSQYGSTTGTEVGSLPESNVSHISTVVGQKSLGTLQTGSGNENTQFGKSVSSLLIKKSQSTESNSFSVSSVLKDQAEQTAQFGSKLFVYPQTTGSSFSKTHLGSSFASPYDKQSFGRHYGSYQDTLLGLVTGSQGMSGQIHSVKPYTYSQITGSSSQQPHLSFSLRDLSNHKPQSTLSKSFSQSYTSQGYNTANKPFDSIPTPLHRYSSVGIGQNHESAASTSVNSGSFSNTQTKYQTTNFGTNGLQPFGGSLTQTVNKETKVFGLTPSTDLLSVAHSIFDQSVSKLANTVPGAQIPISVTEKSSELASFIGKGETFGGPRDPPSFDIKTGYHY